MINPTTERLFRLAFPGDAAAAAELRRHLDHVCPLLPPPPPLNVQALALLYKLATDAAACRFTRTLR